MALCGSGVMINISLAAFKVAGTCYVWFYCRKKMYQK